MAETPKEFQIGNKAKDLLIYTFTVTKPSSEKSLETKDVLSTMLKLKTMKPEEVQVFCADAADRLKRSSGKQGFPKSTIHTYIRLLRETAVNIVVSIQMANDCRFEVEYDKRLVFIDEALKGCNLMLQLVNISLELGYVSIKRSQHWTKLVTDVKYMSLSWKKKDSVRAESLRSAALAKEQAKEDERIARVIAAVMAKLNQDAQR